jgi:hypothetical protein
MKKRSRLRATSRISTKMTFRGYVAIISAVVLINAAILFFLNMTHSREALAASCSTSYTLNWSDPTTYTVTCGTVNAANWTVKADTCTYYSPVTNVGGVPGDPNKLVDIAVRINQSGNLTNNDFAWVYIYVNGALSSTFTCRGDTLAAVFSVSTTIAVPAGGNFQVSAKLKDDKNTEFWQIKNGDVTACVNSVAPLPVELTAFTATASESGILVRWTTASEVNNDYFILSRSSDAREFEEVTRMPGHGTTSVRNSYEFSDDPFGEGYYYYKLTQVDFDGTAKEYGPVAVRLKHSGGDEARAYPNPFTEEITYAYRSGEAMAASLVLCTSAGTVLDQVPVDIREGLNTIPYAPSGKIPPGTYLIGLKAGDRTFGFVKVIRK